MLRRRGATRRAAYLLVVLALSFASAAASALERAADAAIRVVVLKNFPPKYFIGPDGPAGLAIDVIRAVAYIAKLKIKFVPVGNWTEAYVAIREGRADVLPNVGDSPVRREILDFTQPYETARIQLFVAASNKRVSTLDDMEGHRLGVQRTNLQNKKLAASGKFKISEYYTYQEAFFALLSGKVEAVPAPAQAFLRLARATHLGHRIKAVGPPLREVKRGIAVTKGSTALHNQLSGALAIFMQSPAYSQTIEKWYGKDAPYWTPYRLSWAIGVASVLMIFLILLHFNHRLRHTVAELRAAEKTANLARVVAEEAAGAKSRFIATMSHELRTPLNGILGFSQLLETPPPGAPPLSERQTSYAKAIFDAGEHLLALINNLLRHSQTEEIGFSVDPELLDIRFLIGETVKFFRHQVAEKDQHLRIRVERDIGILTADKRAMRQILGNLINNSIAYAGAGATIKIDARRFRAAIVITVSDTGKGIDPGRMETLFDPFSRTGNPMVTDGGGMGLGLSIVKSLITAHGGEITVTSAPDEGTTTTVILPINAAITSTATMQVAAQT